MDQKLPTKNMIISRVYLQSKEENRAGKIDLFYTICLHRNCPRKCSPKVTPIQQKMLSIENVITLQKLLAAFATLSKCNLGIFSKTRWWCKNGSNKNLSSFQNYFRTNFNRFLTIFDNFLTIFRSFLDIPHAIFLGPFFKSFLNHFEHQVWTNFPII